MCCLNLSIVAFDFAPAVKVYRVEGELMLPLNGMQYLMLNHL